MYTFESFRSIKNHQIKIYEKSKIGAIFMKSIYSDENHDNSIIKITNIVTVKARGCAPVIAKKTIFVSKSTDLMVTQTTNKSIVCEGQHLIYTIVITNNGPSSATNIILTNMLPKNSHLVSITMTKGIYYNYNHKIKYKLGQLANGEKVKIRVTIIPTCAVSLKNFITVTAKEHDPNLNNNSLIKVTDVKPLETYSNGLNFNLFIIIFLLLSYNF